MKRTVIALAILAPFALAHAQSSVTLYGTIDAALSVGDSGGSTGILSTRIDSGVGPGSRVGLRGTEDLGGGLRALFTLEAGFDSSTGASQQGGLLFGRQAYVGIGSSQGWSVTLGRQYSPTELAITAADALAQNYWGSSAGYGIGTLQSPGAATVLGAGCQGATLRINNSVQGSWTAGGFTGKLMFGAGDENSNGSGRVINPSVTYSSGPLMLTAAYTRIRQCAQDIAATAKPGWQTETVIGGSYNFGPASLFTGYYNFNPSEANKVVGPTTFVNHKAMWLGTRIPVGQSGTILAQVARLNQVLSGDDAKGTSIGVTYAYDMSKRTRLYISTARLKNNSQAKFSLAGATASQPAGGLGAIPKVFSVGLSHTF